MQTIVISLLVLAHVCVWCGGQTFNVFKSYKDEQVKPKRYGKRLQKTHPIEDYLDETQLKMMRSRKSAQNSVGETFTDQWSGFDESKKSRARARGTSKAGYDRSNLDRRLEGDETNDAGEDSGGMFSKERLQAMGAGGVHRLFNIFASIFSPTTRKSPLSISAQRMGLIEKEPILSHGASVFLLLGASITVVLFGALVAIGLCLYSAKDLDSLGGLTSIEEDQNVPRQPEKGLLRDFAKAVQHQQQEQQQQQNTLPVTRDMESS